MAKMTDTEIVNWIISCRNEAEQAKEKRMELNRDNFDMYHLRHDFSDKQPGQSTEVLSRQSMSVEKTRSFFQQALVNIGEWWTCESTYGKNIEGMPIRPEEITKLTNHFLNEAQYYSHVGNTVQSALLGSLAISKTYAVMKSKPKFVSRKKGRGRNLKRYLEKVDKKAFRLKFDVVRQENYYPDPDGKGLYEIEDMWLDLHEVQAMSEGEDAIFDPSVMSQIQGGPSDSEEETQKSRETGQEPTYQSNRKKVKLTEYWGTILDADGKVCYENIVATVANDTILIRPPEENPLWHQGSPYSTSPLMEVANSVWHKAAMDAPTQHNHALIEIYNLILDAGMKQVHAISQLRKDALDNPAQVADGIAPGTTLMVNSMLPPGAKVMEPVTTTIIPSEVFNIFGIMSQEFSASAMDQDLRSSATPSNDISATEVVQNSQTITSVFQGMAKNYETKQSTAELQLAWMTTAQNWDRIPLEEFVALFGPQRGEELHQMSPQDVFAATVGGIKFNVFGISLTLNKAQDFRKYTTLLQTVGANPQLMEAFLSKYSLPEMLGEIMSALDINKTKLEIPKAVQATMTPEAADPMQAEQGAPDQMSQVPSAAGLDLASMMGMGAGGPQPAEGFGSAQSSGLAGQGS